MQAESLIEDRDLAYSRLDFDRHLLARYGAPTDLELATGSQGRNITFDRPAPYALWLAPFLLFKPSTGFALANVFLLTLVLMICGRRLSIQLGSHGPLLLALLVFSSAVFAHTFFATGDLFLFALVLLAFTFLREPTPRRIAGTAAVCLLAVLTEPTLWPLLVILWGSLPKEDRLTSRTAALLGAFLGFFVLTAIFWWAGGGLGVFGTSSFRFTPETGFPLVDFAAQQWRQTVAQLSALHWQGALKLAWGFDLKLWGWNLINLWFGQSFGLLPYFLPVWILLFLTKGNAPGRRAWWLGFGLWWLALMVFRPFDLSGGETAIANRLFLPICAASVIAWGPGLRRLTKVPLLMPAAALSVLLSAPFLAGLWTDPGAYPVNPGEGYRYPTALAKTFLPYEVNQRPMPGGPLLDHLGVRVRLMDRGMGEEFMDMLSFAEDRPAKLWIASSEPLNFIQLAMDDQAPSEIQVGGAELEEKMLLSDGGIAFRLKPELFRRHNMWWSPNTQWIYRLGFALPTQGERRIRFRVVAETDADLEPIEPESSNSPSLNENTDETQNLETQP